MDDDERRKAAWDNAVNAEGTRAVFARRAKRLRFQTLLRDFSGLAVPIVLAYLLGAEVFAPLKKYKDVGVGALGVATVLQTLMVLWSILARWDEELGYCIHAVSESYLLKESWKKVGLGNAVNLPLEYDLLSARQDIADSRDIEKGISAKEKRLGMRAGLIEFRRQCICEQMPRCLGLPWRKKVKSCVICGGN